MERVGVLPEKGPVPLVNLMYIAHSEAYTPKIVLRQIAQQRELLNHRTVQHFPENHECLIQGY